MRRNRARSGRAWQPRWAECRWLGQDDASDEHMCANAKTGEMVMARVARRFPESHRFPQQDAVLLRMTAMPWDTKGIGFRGPVPEALVDSLPDEPMERREGGPPSVSSLPAAFVEQRWPGRAPARRLPRAGQLHRPRRRLRRGPTEGGWSHRLPGEADRERMRSFQDVLRARGLARD